jgi:hypothetical protein
MAASLFDLLNVPRELGLGFLATFARFELVLKKAGHAHGDWDAFAKPDAAGAK